MACEEILKPQTQGAYYVFSSNNGAGGRAAGINYHGDELLGGGLRGRGRQADGTREPPGESVADTPRGSRCLSQTTRTTRPDEDDEDDDNGDGAVCCIMDGTG